MNKRGFVGAIVHTAGNYLIYGSTFLPPASPAMPNPMPPPMPNPMPPPMP